jgi:hypothetical protein
MKKSINIILSFFSPLIKDYLCMGQPGIYIIPASKKSYLKYREIRCNNLYFRYNKSKKMIAIIATAYKVVPPASINVDTNIFECGDPGV